MQTSVGRGERLRDFHHGLQRQNVMLRVAKDFSPFLMCLLKLLFLIILVRLCEVCFVL